MPLVDDCLPEHQVPRPFDLIYVRRDQTLLIIVHRNFGMDHWSALERVALEADLGDYHQVDIDLRELNFFNSMLLGILVKLNAELQQLRSQLRLIVEAGSRLEIILHLSRLDRIMTIWSTKRVQAVSPHARDWLMEA